MDNVGVNSDEQNYREWGGHEECRWEGATADLCREQDLIKDINILRHQPITAGHNE